MGTAGTHIPKPMRAVGTTSLTIASRVSDESSFYGDEDICTKLELEAARELNIPEFPFAHITAKRNESALASQPRREKEPDGRSSAAAKAKTALGLSKEANDALLALPKSAPIVNAAEAVDFLQSVNLKDNSASWQHDESISAFLERHPVADPKSARVGPWLWVTNPKVSENPNDFKRTANIAGFVDQGNVLLHDYAEQKSKDAGNDSSRVKLPRHMRIRRDKLEEDLLAAAVRTGTTCGKWMLFPGPNDLEKYWQIVAEATSEGRLGPVSKVATPDPRSTKDETLICVYTYDFSDLKDVRRVLNKLQDLGLCVQSRKPIYYKCDAYTYLDIVSNNTYDLRASLFSSKEMFENNDRVSGNGPIVRARKLHGQRLGTDP